MHLSDDYLNIDTPENVIFSYDVAGIGSRFLAALIDTILITILQLIVNITLLLLVSSFIQEATADESSYFLWLAAIFGLIAFGFFWGYYIFFEMIWNGQSPGKRWVKLRVIRTDGTPITLSESMIRNLIRLVDFLPAYYGIGVVTMFVNEQARRLGDLAAGTLVVHDRGAVTLESLADETKIPSPRRDVSATTAALPIERLTPQDLQMIETFLRRRAELSNRSALADQLVKTLFERMEQPVPSLKWWEVEDVLAEIARRSRSRDS